mgnify:CR=1 FL=1
MDLPEVLAQIIGPAQACLPMSMDSPKARLMLLTIGLQESRFEHRYQVLNDRTKKGPARGFWQFEQGGGVKGVMGHSATIGHAHRICAERDVPFNSQSVWLRLETDDILACCFARLLMYSDPKSLPEVDDPNGAWRLYERTWRPGKPHPEKWGGYHARARAALGIL